LFVDGHLSQIGNRAFELLLALIESRGAIIKKSQIISRVWPDIRMDEANLRVQISAVRKALGGDRDVVKTIPGQGYLFAADVTSAPREVDAPAIPVPAADRHLAPGATPQDHLASSRPPSPVQPAANLPYPASTLIGRATELAELGAQLARGRLVTLVGTGGIGKTRLAVELGWQASGQFPGGVHLANLAPIGDPVLLIGTIASALGVLQPDADAPIEAIAAAIGRQRTLLLIDNCEHLVEAVAELVTALLERVPNLSIFATSQESLRIAAEQIYRLRPLAVPRDDPDAPEMDAGRIAGFGAIALFVERVHAVDWRFELHGGNVADVVEICRCLDGIPLALEMAAARLPVLGIEELRAGLGERLRMLKAPPRSRETRHRTLAAMVEWSHGLLDEAEQRVFRRLAIFVGSFSLAAAIGVAGENGDRWDIVDILDRLIDKSLVVVEDAQPPRYRLLETLRIYALERLRAAGEAAAIADLHVRHFTELSDRAHDLWETKPDATWVETYRPDLDNVRAALNWSLADKRIPQAAVALMGPFAIVWYNLGLVAEGRRYAEQALAVVGKDPSPAAARFFRFVSYFWDMSDSGRTLGLLERSAAVYRQLNDQMDLAPVLAAIGRLHAGFDRDAEAEAALGEAQAILSTGERKKSLFGITAARASIAYKNAENPDTLGHLTRALQLARELGDTVREANVLANIAELEFSMGMVERAIERGRAALSLMRSTGRRSQREWALVNLASYLIAQGTLAEARSLAGEALSTARHKGGLIVRACLQQWALLGVLGGRSQEAAQLIGFVDGDYARAGEARQPTERQAHDQLLRLLEATLPRGDIAALAADGARWTERQALEFVSAQLASPR
jgi:predicted ATPase/DNA-binding winged helix-turn-helix (wHTH) protein